MCRNIKTLHNFEPTATDDEIHAAALQYVRKVSGSTKPSKANEAAFERAVHEIAHITQHLLADTRSPRRQGDREREAAKARARAAKRFATALTVRVDHPGPGAVRAQAPVEQRRRRRRRRPAPSPRTARGRRREGARPSCGHGTGKEATPNEPWGGSRRSSPRRSPAQPLRDRERSLEIGIRQQERELVAPEPHGHVACSLVRAEQLATSSRSVALLVATDVVHRLQAVAVRR